MVNRSVAARLAWAAIALGGPCGWTCTLEDPTQTTRQRLEIRYRGIELYRQIHGRLPTSGEAVSFWVALAKDPAWHGIRANDGWGRSFWICTLGETLILHSLGPNGVDDGGGVDDLSIEIEP